MPDKEQVRDYQKMTKTGKVVNVSGYQRTNDDVSAAVAADPTRPPMAAKMGTFPAGRAIPGIWNDPFKHPASNPLVERTEHPDVRIERAINDEYKENQIREKYGVSAKVAKVILEALKEKESMKSNGKK